MTKIKALKVGTSWTQVDTSGFTGKLQFGAQTDAAGAVCLAIAPTQPAATSNDYMLVSPDAARLQSILLPLDAGDRVWARATGRMAVTIRYFVAEAW